MKRVIWRPFWNPIKEEKWINMISANGYMLVDAWWIRYVFEPSETRHVYRIDLLDKDPRSIENHNYFDLMEQSGVKVVSTYMRWVYLQKKADGRAFEIYTDCASKISYFRRLENFWKTLTAIEFAIGFLNIIIGLILVLAYSSTSAYFNLSLGIGCTVVGIVFYFTLHRPIRILRKRVERESLLYE